MSIGCGSSALPIKKLKQTVLSFERRLSTIKLSSSTKKCQPGKPTQFLMLTIPNHNPKAKTYIESKCNFKLFY